MTATLYGIGVGPGDPELITLKARNVLAQVQVIFTPVSKVGKKSVALSIVQELLEQHQQVVELLLPMSKDPDYLERCWTNAAEVIARKLGNDKKGAFITLGDCLLYSTYSYLLKKIKAMFPYIVVESIPGITSFSAASSLLNQPLAEGEEPLAVLPVLGTAEELEKSLDAFPNLVLMKPAGSFTEIYQVLERRGLLDRCRLVSRCGLPGQKIYDDLRQVQIGPEDYLSLIIIKQGE